MNEEVYFHGCKIKYQIRTSAERQLREQQVLRMGFELEGRQFQTDFMPDTDDFLCQRHGLILRFRRVLTQEACDIILTLKKEGATALQENFQLEYRFSKINKTMLKRINKVLSEATGRKLPSSIHDYNIEHFPQLLAHVRTVFPAQRILLEKKRLIYIQHDYRISFDTLPESMGDYMKIEASSPERLASLLHELNLDASRMEPLNYSEILKQHKASQPDPQARTSLFKIGDRIL